MGWNSDFWPGVILGAITGFAAAVILGGQVENLGSGFSDWAAALGTIFLGVMAFFSLRQLAHQHKEQMRNIEKREAQDKNERLERVIIELRNLILKLNDFEYFIIENDEYEKRSESGNEKPTRYFENITEYMNNIQMFSKAYYPDLDEWCREHRNSIFKITEKLIVYIHEEKDISENTRDEMVASMRKVRSESAEMRRKVSRLIQRV